jgi:hypothetical protein
MSTDTKWKAPVTSSRNPLIRPAGSPDAVRAGVPALKAAVRDVLGLGDEHAIVIQELTCAEPGCPPVETVIGVLAAGRPARRWTLHQPLSGLTAEAVRSALTEGDTGDRQDHLP